MPPNSDPGVTAPGQNQTINSNLPSNMYGNVITGRSDYQGSPYSQANGNATRAPYWSSPEARMGRLPQAPVNNTYNNSVPSVYPDPSATYYNNENIAINPNQRTFQSFEQAGPPDPTPLPQDNSNPSNLSGGK